MESQFVGVWELLKTKFGNWYSSFIHLDTQYIVSLGYFWPLAFAYTFRISLWGSRRIPVWILIGIALNKFRDSLNLYTFQFMNIIFSCVLVFFNFFLITFHRFLNTIEVLHIFPTEFLKEKKVYTEINLTRKWRISLKNIVKLY